MKCVSFYCVPESPTKSQPQGSLQNGCAAEVGICSLGGSVAEIYP